MDEEEKDTPVEEQEDELQKLQQEAGEFKDKYMRAVAEQENLRKRLMKERDDLIKHAQNDVIIDFLTPIDQLETALSYAEAQSEEVKHWAIGFEMILNHFKEVLDTKGIKPIDSSVGQPFNPHYHHVTEIVETNDHPPGTIIKETLRGYVCGDKALRAANVVVAKEIVEKEKEEK